MFCKHQSLNIVVFNDENGRQFFSCHNDYLFRIVLKLAAVNVNIFINLHGAAFGEKTSSRPALPKKNERGQFPILISFVFIAS